MGFKSRDCQFLFLIFANRMRGVYFQHVTRIHRNMKVNLRKRAFTEFDPFQLSSTFKPWLSQTKETIVNRCGHYGQCLPEGKA